MFVLGTHPDGLNENCLAYSPDGRFLASAKNVVKLWDLPQRREVREIAAGSTGSVEFSSDGRLIVSASGPYPVQIFDPQTGKLLQQFAHSWCRAQCALISPDRRTLVCGGHFHRGIAKVGRVLVWGLGAKNPRSRRLADGLHGDVNFAAFSPDGRYLVAGGEERIAWLWDMKERKLLATLPCRGKGMRVVAFSLDGQVLALTAGRTIEVWGLEPLKRQRILRGHTARVWGIAFTPAGLLLSAASDGLVRLWNPATRKELACYDWQIGRINNLAVGSDGMTAAAGSVAGTIVVWDLEQN